MTLWWFIANPWVMTWICYTLLTFCDWTRQVPAIKSVVYGCHSSFELTREVSMNRFEIQFSSTPMQNPLNAELNPICHMLALLGVHLILHISRIRVKHLAVTLCINILITSHKFCCGLPKRFCKAIKQRLALMCPTQPLHSGSRPRSAYKEIFLPDVEIFSLAESWILPSPIGRI